MNCDSYVPILALEEGKSYSQVFMVGGSPIQRTARHSDGNKPYIHLTLKDNSGEIKGCVWNSAKGDLEMGQFVTLNIKVNNYRGQKNFTAESFKPYNGKPSNLSDYVNIPNTTVLDTYVEELDKYIGQITDSVYRDIILHCKETGFFDKYKATPYRDSGKLCHAGGLLIHSINLARLTLAVESGLRPLEAPLDHSLLIAGSLLFNCGWISCGAFQGDIWRPNSAASLLGSRRLGFMLVNHMVISAESDKNITFPENKSLAIQSIPEPDFMETPEYTVIAAANGLLNTFYSLTSSSALADEVYLEHHNE